jgi:hypothetical protein
MEEGDAPLLAGPRAGGNMARAGAPTPGAARLDDRLLADIGLTREVQMVECSKLF